MPYCGHLQTTPQDPSVQTVLTWCHQRLCIYGLYSAIQMLLLLLLLLNEKQQVNIQEGRYVFVDLACRTDPTGRIFSDSERSPSSHHGSQEHWTYTIIISNIIYSLLWSWSWPQDDHMFRIDLHYAPHRVATSSCRGPPDTSTNWQQSLFCCCTASMEQTADGAETAAIDGLVSSWSVNFSVWFSLRAPGCALTLWCALGLSVWGAVQVTVTVTVIQLIDLLLSFLTDFRSTLIPNNTFCGTWYLPHSHVHN